MLSDSWKNVFKMASEDHQILLKSTKNMKLPHSLAVSMALTIHTTNFQRIGPLGQFFLWVKMSIYVPVWCLSHFPTSFNAIFAPTSWSPMSKLFKFSFGKSNGKNWSQIGKLLFMKGVKLPRQKKRSFFNWFFFFVISFHSV